MQRLARMTLCSAIVAIAVIGCGMQPTLSLRHRIQESLKPYSAVTTINVAGVAPIRMFLNPNDSVMTPYMWARHVWEPTETYWFVKSVRPGDVVVDVGANTGYYTLIAAKLVGDSGRVYAFEPDPVSFELLQRNVRLNRLHNVVLERKAVSNENGVLKLYIAEENKGDHRIYQPEGEQRESVSVDAVSLNSYFEGLHATVDFVKVDTQGAELSILLGMDELVRRSKEIAMAFEYSPWHLAGLGTTGRELLDEIESHELRIYELGMGGVRIQRLRPVTPENLERRFKASRRWFTNLLLVKGRPELIAAIEAQPAR